MKEEGKPNWGRKSSLNVLIGPKRYHLSGLYRRLPDNRPSCSGLQSFRALYMHKRLMREPSDFTANR